MVCYLKLKLGVYLKMAKITVSVPAGQFCGDKAHLGCMYDTVGAIPGDHRCALFGEALDKVEVQTQEGRQRLLYKCTACLTAMKPDPNDKPIEPLQVLCKGWRFD